ncbi:MAG: hypothetical protein HYX71_12765 [Opitutae bacterium]|nr:hypothetical protein [Opitutae bacterium]
MSSRLLSLLSEIERALVANDPTPGGGTWDTLRLVNFRLGLARLTLSIRSPARVTSAAGSILVQGFNLADGSFCLKANLAWQGTENSTVHAVYSKPETNWRMEAGQIADKWLDGRTALSEAGPAATATQAASAGAMPMAATG